MNEPVGGEKSPPIFLGIAFHGILSYIFSAVSAAGELSLLLKVQAAIQGDSIMKTAEAIGFEEVFLMSGLHLPVSVATVGSRNGTAGNHHAGGEWRIIHSHGSRTGPLK